MGNKDIEETLKDTAKKLVVMKLLKNVSYLLEAHMDGDNHHQQLACRNIRDVLDEYEEVK